MRSSRPSETPGVGTHSLVLHPAALVLRYWWVLQGSILLASQIFPFCWLIIPLISSRPNIPSFYLVLVFGGCILAAEPKHLERLKASVVCSKEADLCLAPLAGTETRPVIS